MKIETGHWVAAGVAAVLGFGWCGSALAENVSSPYATGGDYIYTIDMGGGVTDYVHVFSNKADAATFANISGKVLPVRYLAVGGGGAGGTSLKTTAYKYTGGGGGGGGGVAEAKTLLGAGAEWSINVGKGGISYPKYNSTKDAKDAGATAISNGTSEVINVPAGGRGGAHTGDSYAAQAGAAGGGFSSKVYNAGNGASGTFASYTLSERSVMHSGGSQTSKYYTNETANSGHRYLLPGGGGGAGANGETPTTNKNHPGVTWSAGAGGAGLASDITGETVYYGAGGGAGGLYSPTFLQYVVNSNILAGVGGSGVGGNGGTCKFVDGVVSSVAATAGLNGTGSGGGGGFAQAEDEGIAELGNYRGGLGGDGIVVIRYTGWNVAADTPTFSALGAAGEVTFYACGEVEKDGDQVWLKPGVTASIFAYDAGGNLLSGWEDAETGEFIRGTEVVQVTPATRRNYTAVFGKPWTYDATASTLTNGDWMFAVKRESGRDLVYGCSKAPADGILNMATPIYDTAGNAYLPDRLGDGSSKATSFISNSVCEKVRVFLPDGVGVNTHCFNGDFQNAVVWGSLSIPRSIYFGGSSLRMCTCLTNVYFEGGIDGGQDMKSGYGTFRGCSALTQIGPFPRTYKCLDSAEYYGCTSLTTLDLHSVTNLGYQAFYNCTAMQRITFSTNMLVFTEAYESGKVFSAVPRTCRLEFPGKAPELLIKGTATVDSVEYPYTGLAGKQMFGAQNGIRLYGSWRKDPEGWNKILNEIGSSDWGDKEPPELGDNDRSVRGIFRWANDDDTTEPYYGWLIDTKMPDEPIAGMQIIVR